jgi:hypothetical protein
MAGHVDRRSGVQLAEQDSITVTAGATAPGVAFDYDAAAELRVAFAGVFGGVVPDGVPLVLSNSYLPSLWPGVNGRVIPGESGPTRDLLLFPEAAGYTAWGGDCPQNDPAALSPPAARPAALDTPRGPSTGTVFLGTAAVVVTDPEAASSGTSVDVTARSADPGCGMTFAVGTAIVNGPPLGVALPYGLWTFEAEVPAADDDEDDEDDEDEDEDDESELVTAGPVQLRPDSAAATPVGIVVP